LKQLVAETTHQIACNHFIVIKFTVQIKKYIFNILVISIIFYLFL